MRGVNQKCNNDIFVLQKRKEKLCGEKNKIPIGNERWK